MMIRFLVNIKEKILSGVCPKQKNSGCAGFPFAGGISGRVKISAGLVFGFIISFANVSAQQEASDSSNVLEKIMKPVSANEAGRSISFTHSFQLWNVHTFENIGKPVYENRNDLYIRRGRIGAKGYLHEDISFLISFAYDGVGRNEETAGRGFPNPDDNHDFFLFEAYTIWSYNPLLNIAAGYLRPQVGREQMTSPFKTTSFEYSLSNFQTRAHLVGRISGRELGLNVGGLYKAPGWSLNYNIGCFDISSKRLVGSASKTFPMFTGRLAFTLGDPEMEKYGIGYKQSYYGKRKGITFALNGSLQGETEIFKNNNFYGGDILANYGPFDFMLEYDWLSRGTLLELENSDLEKTTKINTVDKIFTYKVAYNFLLKNGKIIQAAAMYSGQLADDYGSVAAFNSMSGASDQEVFEIGLNYLLNKDNLKLNMHYVWGERTDKAPEKYYAYLGTGFQYLF